ncbi:hypothetical protein RHSIM_Rhsim09G0082900 [Rhododendron simsii]|uniref:BED-type domain-containing protein n=1 Tax=Rhododendron simsii TaxID=118357 RepID=A0A834GJ99_RHOSS|nr:hypothetical protein RHSIM_Rhsim09G0082900 [Rhododendron simsii]
MSESPVGSSAQLPKPVDGSGPSQPSGSPVPSSSPLDNHASDSPAHPIDNPTDEVEVLSDKSDDDGGKRLKSPCWAYYNRAKIGGVYKTICKYCGTKISVETRNGTSHLKEHYFRKHQKRDTMRQQGLTNNFMNKDHPLLLTSYSFDHETVRKELASAIIIHEYPLLIVDHVGFKRIDLLWDKLDSTSLMLGGNLFHMRCCVHILNLIVKDGLDVIKMGIEKIMDSVAYWTTSPKREEKFEETVRQLNVTSTKKLGLDCAARWNSTFLMLQIALLYKDVLLRLSKQDAQYNSLPSERVWGFARDICQKLKFFFKVTELFSGTKYPTTNQCFPNICDIRLELRDWLHSKNQVIREMAKRMVEKFDKYWSAVHGVVGVSAMLDPKYKINVLEFYFKLLFPTTYKDEIEKVRVLCYKLLKEYQSSSSMMEGIGDSSSQLSSMDEESQSKYDIYMLRESKRSRTIDTTKLELDHYLSEAVFQNPRDLMSGRLVSPHRSRFHPDTMEVLMYAQSWLWVAEMKGESTSGYATILDDAEMRDSCVTHEIIDIENVGSYFVLIEVF